MSPRTTDNVTLKSIAKAVGVSVSTVSNAYNHPDQLTSELRAKILKTARTLGYGGPNPLARTLRRGRVGALGIIFDDPLSYAFTDPAAVLTLQGVAGACERAGAGLVLIPGLADDEGEMIRTALVDGFIAYCGVADDPRNEALVDRGIPYVSVDGHPVEGVPWVGIDDRGAAEVAARHLTDLGHRDIGLITLPLRVDGYEGAVDSERVSDVSYFVTRQRLEGYRRGLEAAGIA
jgi:DNA-binding LacI/PurR family transcriptional regulator